VIVPPYWDDPAGRVQLERSHTEGYRLVVQPIRLNGDFHMHYYPQLKKLLWEIRPDILHIDEEPYNLATWLAWRQGRAAGARTVFFSWQNLLRQYPFPFRLMENQVLQGIDYAIMGNQEAAAVWRAKGYKGRYQIIPQFGVDADLFRPVPQRDYGGGFVIGCANRRLVYGKGADILLRAASQLPGVWRLHIAGDGPERRSLEKLARDLGIAGQVFFDGAITSEQMPAYLNQMSVLVLSSRTQENWKEQFGRVLIEAMSCAVPVIGSTSGEIPNVVGEVGLIFPEEDVDALRAHLLSLMQSTDLQRVLGQKGRQHVLANYTQAEIAARTVAVYREMAVPLA
jgi:glycosyltransferase involved in cell wall biosynthesis